MVRTKNRKYKGYVIINKINNKKYIGITTLPTVKDRFKRHVYTTTTKRKERSRLHNAIRKYGKENFIIKLLYTANTWEELSTWEIKTIKKMKTKIPNGYNILNGGGGYGGEERTPWTDKRKKEHSKILKKATAENKEWMTDIRKRNKKNSKDPKFKKKVRDGVRKRFKNPEERKKVSDRTKAYWQTSPNAEKRKKQASETLRKTINKNLKDPTYQKWRKENPPGGKPILYDYKYFRSIQEVTDFFKISRPTIDRHLLQKKKGCKRLNKNKTYNYEVQY